ncbi:MAG TPA: nucleoid-associated protein [Puia sp.]|jgi:hypothetical protein|nr:nucleoid-associated protein [Puia sp.]
MNFTEAQLDQFIVHYTGNKQNGESLLLSKQEQALDADSRQKFTEVLLNRFQQCYERYSFHHPDNLDFHAVYHYVAALFGRADDPANFLEQSVRLASHLYEVALHPKIKPGELYVTHFSNVQIGEQLVEAVGLFKAESKTLFVDTDPSVDGIQLALKEGVELSKIDKGCLILNQEAGKGYELMIFDANGKGEEAQYWKDKFLGVLIRQNEFLHTQGFLTITKNFVTQQLPGEFEVSKTEQIDILNRSMDYFKTHGNFNKDEFETEVLHHEELIHSFRKYDEQYRINNDLEPAHEFEISPQAVKKQARVFKSVIKLDKNFHIYVHGDRELIEKGYDEGLGKHYYKIYFDQET